MTSVAHLPVEQTLQVSENKIGHLHKISRHGCQKGRGEYLVSSRLGITLLLSYTPNLTVW